ncbi:hypothetical protein FOIG_07828 [Fusarium odoratissimum NRRL 54006]|uniref:Uncharacterized protein n=2 Tax=Fusarium oxysporum species complex TaxID=171631 RepID=X0KW47_FUSO5|nr:uncharacterized protein FOIG_07828 [Fusarium odoratissimum NRRL 54006]EXM00975.1 hypothetical protein FOIG_07828 [Fusarium odoratissimum NRRL 54006]TXB98375.1 hypothetical protein FocTR4_00013112 [Fusarium oxysporum f. sp. cubense]
MLVEQSTALLGATQQAMKPICRNTRLTLRLANVKGYSQETHGNIAIFSNETQPREPIKQRPLARIGSGRQLAMVIMTAAFTATTRGGCSHRHSSILLIYYCVSLLVCAM